MEKKHHILHAFVCKTQFTLTLDLPLNELNNIYKLCVNQKLRNSNLNLVKSGT